MKRRLLVVLLALALLVTGCATVPTKGTMRSGSREGPAQNLGGVGVEAKPPRDNLTELQLVTGFLEAMSDSRAFDVARQYMTADAAAAWKPETQTVVYDQRPDSLAPGKGGGIQLTARKIATIDERGEWIPAPAGADRADFLFKVAKVDGQLRVDSVPPGVYLGSNQVDLKLAPRSLYFFNPGREMLVPDPVYLPVNQSSGQAATQLVQELLKGPTKSFANGVVSLAPPGTDVQVSVPVDFGVATVALNDAAAALRDLDRRLLAAQIVWTLNQINLRVRITVGGAPLLPDDPDVLPFANFSQYDPMVPGSSMTTLYGLRLGKVQRVDGLDGASDIAARPLDSSLLYEQVAESFAVNLKGDTGAIVADVDGDKVVAYARLDATNKADPDKLGKVGTQGTVLRPSYDNDENLWIVDKADSNKPRLRVRNRDAKVSAVVVDFRGDAPVVLRMAPDGVRALLVMRSRTTGKNYVQTATVQTTADGKQLMLAHLRRLELPLTDITDAAWNKQGVLVAGASASGSTANRAPWLVNPDGSKLQQLPGGPTDFITRQLASNPNKDTLPAVEDSEGRVHWQTRDLTWTAMEDDPKAPPFVPVYPG